MVRPLASSQAPTPLATPMPPTSKEVRPTRVRNRLVWSRNRLTEGAACDGSRIRQPSLTNAARSSAGMTAAASGDTVARSSYRAMVPGAIRPVSANAAWETNTRGPKKDGVTTRSGSVVRAPATRTVALPRRARSPGFRPRRSSTRGSASKP